MPVRIERMNALKDLGGLCECFVQESQKRGPVAHPHMHQYFELLYCLCGRFDLTAQQRTFCLREGDVALIHPMVPHATQSLDDGKNSYLVLKFTPEALYDTGKQLYGLKYIFPYTHFNDDGACVFTREQLGGSHMRELLEQIYQERSQCSYGYEMALHAYISQVLLWFLRAWHRERNAEIDERSLLRMQQAQSYIETHLDSEIKAEDVATELRMGLSTFSRFFSETAGISFPAYVRSKRLEKAAALLVQTPLSITDIAMETGFSSASYLILCFRQQYGITPTRFRKHSSIE